MNILLRQLSIASPWGYDTLVFVNNLTGRKAAGEKLLIVFVPGIKGIPNGIDVGDASRGRLKKLVPQIDCTSLLYEL
jgi:hypothetical protein